MCVRYVSVTILFFNVFFSIINVSGYDITTSGEIYNLQHNQKISIKCVLLFFSKSCFHKSHSIETYSFMLALVMDKSKRLCTTITNELLSVPPYWMVRDLY